MNEIILNIYLVINNGLVEEFRVVSYEMEGGDDRKIEFLKAHAKEDYPKALCLMHLDKNEKFMSYKNFTNWKNEECIFNCLKKSFKDLVFQKIRYLCYSGC